MSRTDAHVPIAVRIARGELAAREVHDHRFEECDLPRPRYVREWRPSTNCHRKFLWTGESVCSCWMCHAGPQRRTANRNARHVDRVRVADVLKAWAAGDAGAFDELVPPSSSGW